ncbi:cell division cycle 5 [Striga asiatica]|uniref:Cell division cycle 5 n=1 Tax=Striga asiatica TaxID=4170 RepID=A0A5A7RGP6_STRAF|nr:cell division cycle 5 [Striga asiatica]
MATEVLRPQDVLHDRFGVHPAPFHRRRISPAAAGNLSNFATTRKPHGKNSHPKPEARKSSHRYGGAPNSRRRVEAPAETPVAMGKVTILRRGESLSSIAPPTAGGGNPSLPPRKSTNDLPGRKQIRSPPPADVYAGSAFALSPSPRSVPLPSFFSRKDSNDGATRDLRRLLRLE